MNPYRENPLSGPCATVLVASLALLSACGQAPPAEDAAEVEMLARTEFTERIENFFEYAPLVTGQPSQFLIHLTDLSDGSPVSGAEVELSVHAPSTATEVTSTRALVGRVTGIYVAELAVPRAGTYDIRFAVRAGDIDEAMVLSGFEVR